MEIKNYVSPEISVEVMEGADIITTSDPTVGITTSTVESGAGSWEVLS
ncbi:MAG: hypothetical protein IJY18_02075 [Clostridia bacterium]|nr:hypothetical protein [Clostridia bacterium]